MTKEKSIRPAKSRGNTVYWADANKKFIREHSAARPRDIWYEEHPAAAVTALAAAFALALFADLFTPVPFAFVTYFAYVFFLVSLYPYIVRLDKFHQDLLTRAGETVDPVNKKMIKANGVKVQLFLVLIGFLVVTFAFVWFMYIKDSKDNLFVFLLPLFSAFFINPHVTRRSQPSVFPTIFMGLEEGVYFGGAVFPYEVMEGLVPTEKKDGFELYYGGGKVAWGTMPPDDMKHLAEILDIRKKYGNMLKD
jgi:hypothetical protein